MWVMLVKLRNDGHNRQAICEKHSKRFEVAEIELADRDHAKLWIIRWQLGRRNLTDSQRKIAAGKEVIVLTEISEVKRAAAARQAKLENPKSVKNDTFNKSADSKQDDSKRTVFKVAAAEKLAPSAVRQSVELITKNSKIADLVSDNHVTFSEGRKLAALPAPARQIAVKAVEADIKKGEDPDVRAAIRTAENQIKNPDNS